MSSKPLPRIVDSAIKAGLWLLVIAIVMISIGAGIGGTGGVIVSTVGSALATIAVLNFLFEPFQKEALVRELRDSFEVEKRLIDSGVTDLVDGHAVDFARYLRPGAHVRVLPLNPEVWAEQHMRTMFRIAGSHALHVEFLLPDPDGVGSTAMAERLAKSPDDLKTVLRRLPDVVGGIWDEAARHIDSRLEVKYFAGVPGYGVVATETHALIEVGPTIRSAELDRSSRVLVFSADRGLGETVSQQMVALKERLSTTTVGLRPVEQSERRRGERHRLAQKPQDDLLDDGASRGEIANATRTDDPTDD